MILVKSADSGDGPNSPSHRVSGQELRNLRARARGAKAIPAIVRLTIHPNGSIEDLQWEILNMRKGGGDGEEICRESEKTLLGRK